MKESDIMLVQLPNDAESVGYREVRPYQWEQVFTSKTANFTGTESEFLAAGHGYAYVQIDRFTRYAPVQKQSLQVQKGVSHA